MTQGIDFVFYLVIIVILLLMMYAYELFHNMKFVGKPSIKMIWDMFRAMLILKLGFIRFREGCRWQGSGWYVKNKEGVWIKYVDPYMSDKGITWFSCEEDVPYSN